MTYDNDAWYNKLQANPTLIEIDNSKPKFTKDGIPFDTMADILEDEFCCLRVRAERWNKVLAEPYAGDFTKDCLKLSFVMLMREYELLKQMEKEYLEAQL